MKVNGKPYRAVWLQDHATCMIDQRLLPHAFKIVQFNDYRETTEAIRNMTVRGAGSIGAAAACAAYQVVYQSAQADWKEDVQSGFRYIKQARPTAYDLFYAVDKIAASIKEISDRQTAIKTARQTAEDICQDYVNAGEKLGNYGNELIKSGYRILTHCNAGWIALQDWGSALAPIYAAKRAGKNILVYADETRPRLQGAKLTAWELKEEGVDCLIIPDNAAGFFMQKKQIDMVIVGADRIARNGDTANKIGTYEKAVLAKENGIPFYVAAPLSTFDPNCPSGDQIPIEERDENEVLWISGKTKSGTIEEILIAPEGASAANPAFDVTPHRYITAFITNKGIFKPGEISHF